MKELPERIKAIAEYRLQNPTLNQMEIAAHFKVTPGRISQVLSSTQVTKYYPILLRRRFETTGLAKAAKAFEHCIEQSENLQVKEKASHALLKEFKVLEVPDVRVEHTLVTRPTEELRNIVEGIKQTPKSSTSLSYTDAEVVDED